MSRKLLNEELNRLTTEEYKDAEKLPDRGCTGQRTQLE